MSRRRLLLIGVGACLVWAGRVSPELLCARDAGSTLRSWACNALGGAAAPSLPSSVVRSDRETSSAAALSTASLRGSYDRRAPAVAGRARTEGARERHSADLSLHGGLSQFDPRDLRFLQDVIESNGLTEASSSFDADDGDGILGPLELGTQVWRNGRLVEFRSGPDPYGSYGYRIHTLPARVADADALEILDLNSNQLSELPDAVGQLRNLRELRLFGNQLAELPASVGGLRSLRVLMLSGNRLSELPASIGDLGSLEELDLRDNPLTTLPASIVKLGHLRILDLTHPNAPRAFGSDRSIRRVFAVAATPSIQAARLAPISPSVSPSAAALPSDPRFTALPETLASLPELQALYLAGNRLGCGEGGESTERLPPFLRDGSIRHAYGLQLQECP